MISDKWQDSLWLGGFIAIVVLLLGGVTYVSIEAQNEWNTFSMQHHCKLVSRVQGSSLSTTGISDSGKILIGVTSIPGKDGFLCDDGITYFRDN